MRFSKGIIKNSSLSSANINRKSKAKKSMSSKIRVAVQIVAGSDPKCVPVIFLDDVFCEMFNGIRTGKTENICKKRFFEEAEIEVRQLGYKKLCEFDFQFINCESTEDKDNTFVHKDADTRHVVQILILKFGVNFIFPKFITKEIYEKMKIPFTKPFVRSDEAKNFIHSTCSITIFEINTHFEHIMAAFGYRQFDIIQDPNKILNKYPGRVIIYRRENINAKFIPAHLIKNNK